MIRRPPRSPLFPYPTLFGSLFESLAGRPPFSSASAAAVLDMQQHHPPPDLRGLRSDVPKPLAAAVARALAKARERSEEHTSELQSQSNLVCRLLLEKKKALL